jgi:hypothetical protein
MYYYFPTKRILKLLKLAICMSFVTSCKKFVDIPPPETQAESSAIFSSDQTATSAVVGLYHQAVASNFTFFNAALTIYPGLAADELTNPAANTDYDAFRTNALMADNATVNSKFWSAPYRYIYQCNAVLEGLAQSTSLTPSIRSQLQGEMLFTRALTYFYLVNLLGDVPYETGTDYRENSILPRTPAAEIYVHLITDLEQARTLLPAANLSGNIRPGRAAAAALLARIYLYRQDWAKAETLATEVIGSGVYKLESNLNNVFVSTSAETIFQLMKATANTSEGSLFIPASTTTRPTFALTAALSAALVITDQRRVNWVRTNTVSGVSYAYSYKYKVRSGSTVTEYEVVLRLAELYLIRGEARARQNNLAGAQADLNMIRSRAGLPALTAATSADLLEAVYKERQLELFAEWGHRWFDLKRTGRAGAVLVPLKGSSWQNTDTLWPIPLSQIQSNVSLTQNPGY